MPVVCGFSHVPQCHDYEPVLLVCTCICVQASDEGGATEQSVYGVVVSVENDGRMDVAVETTVTEQQPNTGIHIYTCICTYVHVQHPYVHVHVCT